MAYKMPAATLHEPQRNPRSYSHITVRPLSGALGAEVSDIDLARLDYSTFAEIQQALLDHQVLSFPDQDLTPEAQTAFATRFGSLMHYPFATEMPDHPFLTEIRSEPDDQFNFGGGWHSDSMNFKHPPSLTMLYCRVCPEVGGDTSFTNMYLAWDSISPGLQRLLKNMRAMSATSMGYGSSTNVGSVDFKQRISTPTKMKPEQEDEEYPHPVARVHPETGHTALYLSAAYSARFERMTQDESLPLLKYLWESAIQPEFTCRVAWRPNTLTLWDNRCCMHYAHNDYSGALRVMWRVLVAGDRPV
jgi:taurine dioxygenase